MEGSAPTAELRQLPGGLGTPLGMFPASELGIDIELLQVPVLDTVCAVVGI